MQSSEQKKKHRKTMKNPLVEDDLPVSSMQKPSRRLFFGGNVWGNQWLSFWKLFLPTVPQALFGRQTAENVRQKCATCSDQNQSCNHELQHFQIEAFFRADSCRPSGPCPPNKVACAGHLWNSCTAAEFCDVRTRGGDPWDTSGNL